MTKKKGLIAQAQELGVQLTGKETIAQLEALLQPSIKPEENAPVFESDATKTEFEVYNSSGGYVRTYSLELHGEDAEALAHQYAGKIGGSVR